MGEPAEVLQERLAYSFRQPELLRRALTHRSLSSERPQAPENADNEPLEFLGDSVLGFVVSEYVFEKYPEAREGQLSQLKAHLVSSSYLYRCALQLNLGAFLLLGHGEEINGGRQRKSLLSNALEAVIAAVHLDGGLDAARALVRDHVLGHADFEDASRIQFLNHKSVLQEKAQALGLPAPKYVTVETSGPEHAKVFTVEVRMGERSKRATGSSKKAASQNAAQLLVEELGPEVQSASA